MEQNEKSQGEMGGSDKQLGLRDKHLHKVQITALQKKTSDRNSNGRRLVNNENGLKICRRSKVGEKKLYKKKKKKGLRYQPKIFTIHIAQQAK